MCQRQEGAEDRINTGDGARWGMTPQPGAYTPLEVGFPRAALPDHPGKGCDPGGERLLGLQSHEAVQWREEPGLAARDVCVSGAIHQSEDFR